MFRLSSQRPRKGAGLRVRVHAQRDWPGPAKRDGRGAAPLPRNRPDRSPQAGPTTLLAAPIVVHAVFQVGQTGTGAGYKRPAFVGSRYSRWPNTCTNGALTSANAVRISVAALDFVTFDCQPKFGRSTLHPRFTHLAVASPLRACQSSQRKAPEVVPRGSGRRSSQPLEIVVPWLR